MRAASAFGPPVEAPIATIAMREATLRARATSCLARGGPEPSDAPIAAASAAAFPSAAIAPRQIALIFGMRSCRTHSVAAERLSALALVT